jgi:hypothetical protein
VRVQRDQERRAGIGRQRTEERAQRRQAAGGAAEADDRQRRIAARRHRVVVQVRMVFFGLVGVHREGKTPRAVCTGPVHAPSASMIVNPLSDRASDNTAAVAASEGREE